MMGNCWVCGKKIVTPYDKKVYLQKYNTCGVKCRNKLVFECLPLNEIEKRSHMKCCVCGKPAVFAKNVKYYCSEQCRRIAFAPIKAWNDKFDAWLASRLTDEIKPKPEFLIPVNNFKYEQLSLF